MAARSSSGGTVLASGIRTREKKERKLYSDDWALGDEEIEGHHTFNLEEKITTPKFDLNFVKDMTDTVFDLSHMQKNGFNWPLLFRSTKHLGIVIPKKDFTINDVRLCVGSRRMLDVMDVNTQKNVEMTMKDWQRYYESQDKDKLLNVISLEFSHTKLETLVEAPTVVRQIDWVEKVWPRHLKEAQTESTNVLEDMMYPKVQKYCLMSVAGCYTDFHIDFGGTSVWYHILKGKKIFWLIPPSERNLQLYEQWVLSGKQGDVFFGDTVEKCARVELQTGNTFFIPTGWIHAVYTPEDSLVFGGNFLHSFGIEKQLRVANVEDTTHVPQKFRYPFFTEMLWYLLERYVHVLLGRTHLTLPSEEQEKFERAQMNNKPKEHIHLTQYELHGMKAIVMYLHSLPTSKKFVPELIKDPIALIRDVRTVVEHHRYDSPELAVTNQPVMEWWEREAVKYTVKRSVCDSAIYVKKRRQSGDEPKSSVVKLPPNVAKVRHRRVRCKECDPCTREDCQQCTFCRDMVKYGGGGTMKQTCKLKKCAQPMLPATASCYICHMDGWMRPITGINTKPTPAMGPSALMECIICFKISHASCLEKQFKGVDCVLNEDLPGSWECAECIQLGYNKEYKHNRTPSSRISSAGSDTNVKSPLVLSESENVKSQELKTESNLLTKKFHVGDEEEEEEDVKPPLTLNGTTMSEGAAQESPASSVEPPTLKMPTWEQLQARVSYPLVRPSWVIRPAPPPPGPDPNDEEDDDDDDDDSGTDDDGEKRPKGKTLPPPVMQKDVMLPVFGKLPRKSLLIAMRVCRQWAEWAVDPSLWRSVSLAHNKMNEFKLMGVIRRQPSTLILDWSEISYDEFSWFLCRLPQLQNLHCEGVSWGVIRPLVSPYCPPLSELNISFCEGVEDDKLSLLLRPPPFNRPGFRDTTSRLHQLVRLRLAGTRVGDSSVSMIVRYLPFLTHLDLSGCMRITDTAPEYLAHSTSLVSHSLTHVDLRGCHQLTPMILPALAQLPILSNLALHPCDLIPLRAIKVWGATHSYNFDQDHIMTREPPKRRPTDGISDDESEVSSSKMKIPRKEESTREKLDSQVVVKKENEIKRENSPDDELRLKRKDIKIEKETTNEFAKIVKKTGNNVNGNKVLKEKDSSNTIKLIGKRDASQLKCVLTPLEQCCKSGDGRVNLHAAKYVHLAGEKGASKHTKVDKSKGGSIAQKSVESKQSSASFRRSERSNKGRKYKMNLVKRKAVKEKLNLNEEKDSKMDDESPPQKKLEAKAFKTLNSKTKRKDFPQDLKRRTKKNIMTRSKRQQDEEVLPKPEYEVVQRLSVKSLKGSKDGTGKTSSPGEHDEGLKVRIALKTGPHYVSKLRKKSREDGSSSPSSSPESKPNSGSKTQPRKQEETAGAKKSKEPKDIVSKSGEESQPSSSFITKRKERTGSSSSSPSPSPSPSPCLSLPKRLKVELKPISKIGRRKSDVLRTSSTTSSKSDVTTASGGQSGTANPGDKLSSRERPERHHRSPRRLSMCQ